MKRAVLCLVELAMVLWGSTAMAGWRLYDLAYDTSVYYQVGGAMAWVSDTITDGVYNIEGRVFLRNISEEILSFPEAELIVYDADNEIVRVTASDVTPGATEPGGYTLVTFSGPMLQLGEFKSPNLKINCKPYRGRKSERYIGLLEGWFEKSKYDDGGRMKLSIDGLPAGIYDINLLAFDKNMNFLWGEDCTLNTDIETIASKSIEDYEKRLFEAAGFGKEIDVYGVIYKR